MKKIFTLLFCLSITFFLCQKIELKTVTDSSQVFKGEINGVPITMQLDYSGIIDCHQYQHFVDGWYYYDKYRKKIPLTGIYSLGEMYLYNFGDQQKKNSKFFKEKLTGKILDKADSIANSLKPKEVFIFPGQDADQEVSGTFSTGNKNLSARLLTKDSRIYRFNNYLNLPNHKKINTYDIINKAGGNALVSYASDQLGNRILLYFEEPSNFNYCGMCGAGEGEKGYRVLYFTKDWNYRSFDEYLTESCRENIEDTRMTRNKDSKTLTFGIPKTSSSAGYTLTVDVKNASVTRSR
ncbi:hypothetical protein MKJ01_02385 [Chryseobacterium sp. SSA4.19]|uniref:hypothetical protein n=1 Tax=Chryseobacterium sp. SSA4.19 TaxID=2919915 RepID=UPI001F4EBB4E|nr:hypothetical protein [Chryseobacterium sp. SSA4.19]MCJ8152608.1 hypothetical protein [Chryseobacterium sp. SSA4.19]